MNALFHIGLTVSDIERSTRFYTGLLGFRAESDLKLPHENIDPLLKLEPSAAIHARYLVLGTFTLELMQFDPPGSQLDAAAGRVFNQTGLAHISVLVDDVEATLARVEEFGGSKFGGIPGAATIRDPDGQLIELCPLAAYDAIVAERTVLDAG